MRLTDVLPQVNPDGDTKVCHDVMPMGVAVGIVVLCDRQPKHTGKHIHHSEKGRTQWWGEEDTPQ